MEPLASRPPEGPRPLEAPLTPEEVLHLRNIDQRITDLTAHSEALKRSLTSIEKSASHEIPARLAEAKRLHHVPACLAQTKENSLEFLELALIRVQEEQERLNSEKTKFVFPLQDLPPEIVGHIIEKADLKTRAATAKVSHQLRTTTIGTTKFECEKLITDVLRALQESLPMVATHDPEATQRVVHSLSLLNATSVHSSATFDAIIQAMKGVRNQIIIALDALSPENANETLAILTSIFSAPENEHNAAKEAFSFLINLLKAATNPRDEGGKYDAIRGYPEVAMSIMTFEGDIEGALVVARLIPSYHTRDTTFYQIAKTMIHHGDLKGAATVVESIKYESLKDYLLKKISLLLAEKDDVAGAIAIANRISYEPRRAEVLKQI